MHYESLVLMAGFIKKYLDPNKQLKILDIGSMDISECNYRKLFEGYNADEVYFRQKVDGKDYFKNPNWTYIGADLQEGLNVDIILKSSYDWGLFEQYDVIISGQTLEHVEDMNKWILEIRRALKKDGIVCIIVPWQFAEHRPKNWPFDFWRVLPDGMKFLMEKIAKLEVINIYMYMGDTVGIAKKITDE